MRLKIVFNMRCDMDKLISVIVPIYKVEKYLKKCVDSLLVQTYKNLEIILVDDGSPDNCSVICDQYALMDSRVKVIHQKNSGLSAARNTGIKIAKGEFIAFVDSDDYIAPNMYEEMFKLISRADAELAICNVQKVDEKGKILDSDWTVESRVYDKKEIFQKLNGLNAVYYITAWNKLYRRELFSTILFPVGKIHEDEFIIHEIFDKCNRIVSTDSIYYFYLQRDGSIMSNRKSVKSLDGVEALYNRFYFYNEHEELCKYKINTARNMWNIYSRIEGISISIEADRKRIKESKNMLKSVYREVDKNEFTWCDWGKYLFPNLFVKLRKVARKFRIRMILHRLKTIINYIVCATSKECILLDTPEHGNLGDHAIVLAEQQVLQKLGVKYTEVTAEELNKLEKWYSKLTPMNHYIVIHGGGFLGALWPVEEYRFRRILKAFKGHRIIVFPQTITFDMNSNEGIAFFHESKQVYTAHKNLTICVREKMSLEFMHKYMPEVNVILVPDIVTLLKYEKDSYDRNGILLCMRTDKEKALSDTDKSSILKIIQTCYPNENLEYMDTVVNAKIKSTERNDEVDKKLDEFYKSRLVVTDRLHGMIFAAITGTPCIAFGNSNGKVKAVYKWIEELPYIYFVNNVDEMKDVIHNIRIDIQYTYDRKIVEGKFKELYELLKKETVV